MCLARRRHTGPDGPQPRIVATADPDGGWMDVRAAARLRLERRGVGRTAAGRIAAAVAPASMAEALEAGPVFLEAASAAAADDSGDALPPSGTPFLAPVDPPAYRDFMVFERHSSLRIRVARDPRAIRRSLRPFGRRGRLSKAQPQAR